MMQEKNGILGEDQNKISIRERLALYLSKWPLFIICILFCIAAGIIYTRYTKPKYLATTSFLIKGNDNEKHSADLIETSLNSTKEININNEILLVSSASLMERTVAKNAFNTFYYKKGRMLDIDIYKDAPFDLIANNITDSNNIYQINIKNFNATGGTFIYGPDKKEETHKFTWNVPFIISAQSFLLSPKKNLQGEDGNYIVRWEPVNVAAAGISNNLDVKAYDPKTNVIELTLKTENLKKGEDILNALFYEFNLSDIETRNNLSQKAVRFIDDRLSSISGQLTGVEGNLESYQGNNQLIDIKGQSSQSLQNSNDVSKTIRDLAIKQDIASMISNYFEGGDNGNKLVPSALGLEDGTLSSLITQYNELVLKKEREAPSVAANSTVMQDLNAQLGNLKGSILESLSSIAKNLRLQKDNLEQQNNQYKNYLSAIPHDERVLQEIKRKQSVTEGLYLYLLQKREEAAISGTGTNVIHYKQIDPATGYGPVEPNTKSIITYCAILGFFIALAWIYLLTVLNDKITSKDDIIKRTSLPVIGQVSHYSGKNKDGLPVTERGIIGEELRAIRTSLYFLFKETDKKNILITSSLSDEGKSFISMNLAAVFAMPGKKVALLEFDTRHPVLKNILNIQKSKGLTDYLEGSVNSITEICNKVDSVPGLHLYVSGSAPAYPADLLSSQNMSKLFTALRASYDYIIIDSPPAEIVSDPYILAEYSDIVLYIVRWQKTLKKQIDFINDSIKNESLKNVAIVLNDTKTDKKSKYKNYLDSDNS